MTLTRCPRCGRRDAVLVFGLVPFVVESQNLHGQYWGRPWGDLSVTALGTEREATCNAYGCNWKGTLADALEAAER